MSFRKTLLMGGFFVLFIGSAIYILWRPTSLLMFEWFNFLGLRSFVDCLRDIAAPVKHLLPSFVIYSLPWGLWLLSYLLFVEYVWFNKVKTRQYHFWFWIFPFLSVLTEILQKTSFVPGTFCFEDIVALILSILLGYAVSIYNNKKTFNQRRVPYDT